MSPILRKMLVLLVCIAVCSLGVLTARTVWVASPPAEGGGVASAASEPSDAYTAFGDQTALHVVAKDLTAEEISIAGQVFSDDAGRELVLRGFWLRDRVAQSPAEIVPFLRVVKEKSTSEKYAQRVSLSMAVLVKQWYRGAPVEELAPVFEAAAVRHIDAEDDTVRLQSAMLLSVMAENGRGHTLSPAARRALRAAEQNEFLANLMAVKRNDVLAKPR